MILFQRSTVLQPMTQLYFILDLFFHGKQTLLFKGIGLFSKAYNFTHYRYRICDERNGFRVNKKRVKRTRKWMNGKKLTDLHHPGVVYVGIEGAKTVFF